MQVYIVEHWYVCTYIFPVGTTIKTEKTETEKMGWNETNTFPSQRDTFFSFSF